MALLGNYSVLNKTPGRFVSGLTIAQNRSNFNSTNADRNFYLHSGLLASIPSGYSAPYSWSMAQAIGAMSSFTSSSGAITPSSNLAGGYNLVGSAALAISYTNAQLDQIVTLVCSALMSATVSNANLSASVNAQASSVMSIATAGNIGAIISALASSSSAIIVNAIISALGYMDAAAGGPTALSPEGLAVAVWSTQISSLRAEELLALLETINTKLDEVHKIQGLDSTHPMTVTESTRVAGSVTQNFTGDGISTTTVTRV